MTAAVGDPDAVVCGDSKKYTRKGLTDAAEKAKEDCLTYITLRASPAALGSTQGQYLRVRADLFYRCIQECRRRIRPRYCDGVVDGSDTFGIPCVRGIPRADSQISVVGAASCIGKASQLAYMRSLHEAFPDYGFDSHAGYATEKHCAAIVQHGMIPGVHRANRCLNWARRRGIHLHFNGDPSRDYSPT